MHFGTVHCAKWKLNVFEIFTERAFYIWQKRAVSIVLFRRFLSSDWQSYIQGKISHISLFSVFLGKARLLSWDIAPLLDDGLLDLPGVGPGPGADLLGHVHALLGGLQLGNQLGHIPASYRSVIQPWFCKDDMLKLGQNISYIGCIIQQIILGSWGIAMSI